MNDIKETVRELGLRNVEARLEAAEKLDQRAKTHVGFVGAYNSGKTTLLNSILEQEVRKPSIIPNEGLPLRIVFDRTEEDEHFDCANVFHRHWNSAEVVFYEISNNAILRKEALLDELDILFYIMPISRFMTADDTAMLTRLADFPVRIIASKCDDVDNIEEMKVYAEKECTRMNVRSPIFFSPEDGKRVSDEMRMALPVMMDLREMRKKHKDLIIKSSKSLAAAEIERLISEERQRLQNELSVEEKNRREAEIIAARDERHYQEMKLKCSEAYNEASKEINAIIRSLEEQAQKSIAEGAKSNSDAGKPLQTLLGTKLNGFLQKTADSFQSITDEAIAFSLLTSKEQKRLIDANDLIDNVRSFNHQPEANANAQSFVSGKTAGTSVFFGAAAAGLAQLITHSIPIAAILGTAVTAGSVYLTGVQTQMKHRKQYEDSIRNWVSECARALQHSLLPVIKKQYSDIADALHLLQREFNETNEKAKESVQLQKLLNIKASFMADE